MRRLWKWVRACAAAVLWSGVLAGLVVRPDRMLQNLESSGQTFFSQAVMLELVRAGMGIVVGVVTVLASALGALPPVPVAVEVRGVAIAVVVDPIATDLGLGTIRVEEAEAQRLTTADGIEDETVGTNSDLAPAEEACHRGKIFLRHCEVLGNDEIVTRAVDLGEAHSCSGAH